MYPHDCLVSKYIYNLSFDIIIFSLYWLFAILVQFICIWIFQMQYRSNTAIKRNSKNHGTWNKDLAIKEYFLILKIAMIFEFLVKLVFELWRLCIEELLFLLTLTHWRHKEIALFLSRCSWPSKISPRKLLFCVPWSNVTDYKRKYILQIVNKMT